MAIKSLKSAKTETLSLRLDPKTRFVLEFMARVKGQSITTLVERAIKEMAGNVKIGDGEFGEGGRDWASFWDASDGVRTLKLLADSNYPTTFDEDEVRAFTLDHWPFFYTNIHGTEPHRGFVEILWPSIQRYMEIWREKKSKDLWAAGEAVKADLSSARVTPPDWPPKTKPQQSSAPEPAADFDDKSEFRDGSHVET